jgi:hypothetical protein
MSNSSLPQPEGPGPHIYIPQEQSGPVILPGTGLPFRRLLQLTGLWWRYSNQPPHGEQQQLSGPAYNISAQTMLKTPFLCCMPSHQHRLCRDPHSSVVVYGLLPSNDQLLWLHNSCFEWIRHNKNPKCTQDNHLISTKHVKELLKSYKSIALINTLVSMYQSHIYNFCTIKYNDNWTSKY